MYSNVKKGYFKYQQTDVMSLSSVEIIDRLLKAMCSDIERAAEAMEKGDIASKGARITRAIAIAGELQASLNFKEGGEIAERLNLLYDYVIRELLYANLKNEKKRLENAKSAILPIIEAWQEVVLQNKPQVAASVSGESTGARQLQTAL